MHGSPSSWVGINTRVKAPTSCSDRCEIAETFDHEPWHGVGARLVHASGREFLAWSIWLDYRAYIPYVIRDNPQISDGDLLKSEGSSQRLPWRRLLARSVGCLDSNLPLLVGGDWNTPSHLDWTRYGHRLQEET